jgi:hypothetical protein
MVRSLLDAARPACVRLPARCETRAGAAARRPTVGQTSAGGARPLEDFQGDRINLFGCPVYDPARVVLAARDLLGEAEVAMILEPAVERPSVGEADAVAWDVAGLTPTVAVARRPRLGGLGGVVAVQILADAEQDTCSLERILI